MESNEPRTLPDGLTRGQAAARLGVSVASVRRMEGKELHPVAGPDGVHTFDPAEVDALAQRRAGAGASRAADPPGNGGSRAAGAAGAAGDGELAADVFARLDAGAGLSEIVRALKVAPELVLRFAEAWERCKAKDPSAALTRVVALERKVTELQAAIPEIRATAAKAAAAGRCGCGAALVCWDCGTSAAWDRRAQAER